MQEPEKTTDFGFKTVPWEDKEIHVREVFHSVAPNYNLMNDCMSLGLHRLWKRYAIYLLEPRKGHTILDLAGGTGDLTKLLSPKVGIEGQIILADINRAMMQVGKETLLDQGLFNNIAFVQANAEQLPFKGQIFDRIIIGFGLRNVTDKEKALRSMYQSLKPGGKLGILEFSTPTFKTAQAFYDWYTFYILPQLGKWVAKDSDSYQYLAESIKKHPDKATLNTLVEKVGFEDCHYHSLTGGIVALHLATKY